MKKKRNKIFTALALTAAIGGVNAQQNEMKNAQNDFNKWSVELSGGFNKPDGQMTKNYFTSTVSPFTVDLGIRYMFNNKFGLKVDAGYNSFEGQNKSSDFKVDAGKNINSADFKTKYYRADIQAVANLGRILSFETWTNTIGLLGHAGFGLAQLEDENSAIKDRMGNFMAGITGQIKLSNRIVLTGDFTTIVNAVQDHTFDAASTVGTRGFSGVVFNGTIGVGIYLGKNKKHADWIVDNGMDNDELRKKIEEIETSMLDTDKDGVADYLDIEPNTISGTMVNTKGKSIDNNNNNIPDELESYILKTYGNNADKSPIVKNSSSDLKNNELVKNLINENYVATFFDYKMSTPTNVSTEGIDFVLTYLRNNPGATVDIIGHADEIGSSDYNNKLSQARAQNVKKILIKGGIESSRLNVIGAGEDNSVDKNSDGARKLVRRVTFKVK